MTNDFQFWLKMLDQIALLNGYKTASIVAATDLSIWRPYYEQGLSPAAALEQAINDSAEADAEINGEVEA